MFLRVNGNSGLAPRSRRGPTGMGVQVIFAEDLERCGALLELLSMPIERGGHTAGTRKSETR